MQKENYLRALSYSRFIQYVKLFYPGLRLSRSKEDLCDACVRIEIRLADPGLEETEREALKAEQEQNI